MAKCYIHSNKNSVKNCTECNNAICRECLFEERVAARLKRSTYRYQEYEYDYGFFCPECFIERSKQKGYNNGPQGVFFRFKNSPSIIALIIMWSFFLMAVIVNFFFPIGYILYIGTIISMVALKVTANKNYNRYLKAKQLLEPQIEIKPLKKKDKESGNFCPGCGANNPVGSKYCNECGNNL